MTSKTRNIVNWVLAGLVAFIFIASGVNKLMGGEEALKMAQNLGLSASTFSTLGAIELVAVVLFLYPRTGVLGSLLLIAYMGGAIATLLEHGESIIAGVVIAAFVWIVTVVRFPELTTRIMGK